MRRSFKDVTFALRTTIVATVVIALLFAIALTVGTMGVPTYFKTKDAFKSLWKDYSKQVAETATEKILSYFQSAPIMLKFINDLAVEEAIDPKNLEELLDVCYRAVKENPAFVSTYFSSIDGNLYGVFRQNNRIYGNVRTIDADGKTLVKEYKINAENKWVVSKENVEQYDPRRRPFWEAGQEYSKGSWTNLYQFFSTKATGFTYVLGSFPKGKLDGFWAIDFEVDSLSSYLRSMSVGGDGSIYLIADSGKVVSQSKPRVGETPQLVEEAWGLFLKTYKSGDFVSIPPNILYIDRFPQKSHIPWNIVTVIHENDYLKPIRSQMLVSFYWGLIPCALFLLIAALFFGRISRRMRNIARDIGRVGNLDFGIEDVKGSKIREINMMEKSLQKMKVGLQSFSKYAPMDLVKKLVSSATVPKLGGEKKAVTILFADLDHFTALAERNNPAHITNVLGKFLDLATKEIHKEKGIIDKFLGDAVMALWGAPDPLDDHALRACRMALTLKKMCAKDSQLKFKVGINTGEATVGNFGSHERMDYTAIGDAVNIAARLEKINKIYQTQILIGSETAKAVENTMLIRMLDWATVPGRLEPVMVYELIGEKKDANQDLLKAIEIYTAALKDYREKRFEEAAALFAKANQRFGGNDMASKVLLKRSTEYGKRSVPKNWNGAAIPEI